MQSSELTRNLVIILLISSVLMIAWIPSATSQQFTTSTSFLTSTQTETSTQYYQTSQTITSSSIGALLTTVSATSAYTTSYTIAEGPFPPQPWPTDTCYVAQIEFNSIGATVHLHYLASEAVSVFILNQTDVNAWIQQAGSTSTCTLYPNGLIVGFDASNGQDIFAKPLPYLWMGAAMGSTSGDAYLTLPVSGNPYLLMIVAYELYNSPVATVTLDPVSTVSSSTVTSTVSIQLALTRTDTLTTATTLEIPFTQFYGNWIVAAVIGVLVIVVLFFTLRMRPTHRPKQATLSQFVRFTPSCVKCGAELPPASEFCNKCGTKQS